MTSYDPLFAAMLRKPFYMITRPPNSLTINGWRWNLRGGNGEIMMQGEGHPTEALCRAAIERIRMSASTSDIRVV